MVSLISTERASSELAPVAGGSLKRKFAETDTTGNLSLTETKRRRVTFDPEVDVHIFPDVNEKSLELVGEEVRRALEKHAVGDNSTYDQIRGLFAAKPSSPDAPSSSLLQKYLTALNHNVTLLDHKCSGLVHGIVDSSWIARNEHYVRSFRALLRSLLSVQPGYTGGVLHMLVNMFVELPSPTLHPQDDPAISRPQLQVRLHDCLKHLLRHIQMASTLLGPILASAFPFPTDPAKTHAQYIKNLLRVSEYCPELKGQIFSVITDKLVKIDVQIQDDMEELDDDIEDRLVDGTLGDVDDDEEDDVSDDESVSSEKSVDPEEERIKQLKESVMKLDTIMDLLFKHYDSVFARGDLAQIDDTFENLLAQFASIILPSYRSRHTQFLLFHFSQTSPELVERFAGCCSHLAFDPKLPQILRVTSAAYLASFIARGAQVSREVVRDVFDLLCHHLESLRSAQEPNCRGPDLRRYGTYYAIAQALLYTFCFRWRDLIVTEGDRPPTDDDIRYNEVDFNWHNSIQDILRRNVFSKLNPLKICAPTIVAQFARMAHHLRFLYVFPLIETNKRIRLARNLGGGGYMDGVGARETALTMKKGEQTLLLDAYFPFDPYVLPRSKRWVEQDYVEWRAVPGMQQEEEEEEEDDEEEEDESDEEEDEEEQSASERGRVSLKDDEFDTHEEEEDVVDDSEASA
ncbi:RNA polymerase I-specific transcription initiation factor RRN3 [Westerdykella ornata]|uniref:RNA polymerase I-specific transcription initiation factor RRN3 n=1 Tax=Westerdykella ornata TaxID=318751 RepID=A0A6A6JXP3_WESOR|nr:RNA polymerase I-specific transcription initiation factor RRN3 [Westerdykella ornata]KAF2281177.1 RNA polymerase I-specific transcription initiation factor RRN3 [Westerdykella ornata]